MLELHIERSAMLGLKGPRSGEWLRDAGLTLPKDIYDIEPIDGGGRLLRIGSDEYVVEVALAAKLSGQLGGGGAGTYRVERQEITLQVIGDQRAKVLAQTCGLDPQQLAVGRIYYTRVAGATVAIIPHADRYELWVDPSLADYLSDTLREIIDDCVAHHSEAV